MSDEIAQLRKHLDGRLDHIDTVLRGDGLSEKGLVSKVEKAAHDANNARTGLVNVEERLSKAEQKTRVLWDERNGRVEEANDRKKEHTVTRRILIGAIITSSVSFVGTVAAAVAVSRVNATPVKGTP